MNNTIKMQKKNEDGKIIIKEVPLNLVSSYEAIGWTIYKQIVKPIINKTNENI